MVARRHRKIGFRDGHNIASAKEGVTSLSTIIFAMIIATSHQVNPNFSEARAATMQSLLLSRVENRLQENLRKKTFG